MSISNNSPEELPRMRDEPIALREVFGGFPSGVAAICAEITGEPIGFVVSSLSVGVSLSPPLISFAVQKSSTTWPKLLSAPSLGVSVLAENQQVICSQLGGKSDTRFAGIDLRRSETKSLFVEGAAVFLDCQIFNNIGAGDHDLVLLEVTAARLVSEKMPLVFHSSQFSKVTANVA